MKLNKFVFVMAAAFSFTACSNEKQPEYDPSLGAPINKDSTAGTAAAAAVIGDTANKAQTLSIDTNKAVAAAGLNPAHGQPGHRCDIAVGAPLNSAPAKPSGTQTVSPTNAAVATPAKATPTKTAPGMNPPHGEPGHRCDIAVGAPLNSAPPKPATTTTATAVTPTPAATTPLTKEQLLKQQEANKSNNNLEPDPAKPVPQTNPEEKKGG